MSHKLIERPHFSAAVSQPSTTPRCHNLRVRLRRRPRPVFATWRAPLGQHCLCRGCVHLWEPLRASSPASCPSAAPPHRLSIVIGTVSICGCGVQIRSIECLSAGAAACDIITPALRALPLVRMTKNAANY
ncbi:uncharacterized protein BDZ99DRAFT_531379 [Mytilinidion resinicola]|uniref:Uncharacterized protein n=1 Tax=Mytilinidion resinicola TaxID=574789 RepID=A0A6A6YN59_9PEZI|nr:uncharacterized protein BDZ99DRAFT_531379 [Mytilinidion resinicola]KAF2809307.1 hypothetical protein BDZ99DRAFT_531379 [Mytilinidion resinicola]